MIQSGCAPDSRINENVLKLKGKIFKAVCGRSRHNFLLFWTVERSCFMLPKKAAWAKFSVLFLQLQESEDYVEQKAEFILRILASSRIKKGNRNKIGSEQTLCFLSHVISFLPSDLFLSCYQVSFVLYFGCLFTLWLLLPHDCGLQTCISILVMTFLYQRLNSVQSSNSVIFSLSFFS